MKAPDHWEELREMIMDLAIKVKNERLRRQMSQPEFVEALGALPGWHVPALSQIEGGSRLPPRAVSEQLTQALLQAPEADREVRSPTPARNTDPDTSRTNRPTASTKVHEGILSILNHYLDGGLAHFEIVNIYNARTGIYEDAYPIATPQRIRTAVRELVDAGKAEAGDEYHTNARGRKCKTWVVR